MIQLSTEFRSEISMVTIMLLWSISLLPLALGNDDLPQLQVKIIKESKGVCDTESTAQPGDFLSVHYTGRFDDENGEIFDTSHKRGQLYKFQLGAGRVIQGYEQGVPGMCKGETRTLTVPPRFAYGQAGIRGVIPPGATLHFTVELVELEKGKLKSLHPGLRMDL